MSTRSTDGAPGPLRILVVAPFLPYPPEVGTATRIFQLARHLSRRHEVTLIAYGRASDAAAVDSLAGHGIRAHAVVPPPRIRAPGTPPLAGIERLHTRARMVASLPLPGSYQGRYLVTNELRSALARLFATCGPDVVQVETIELWRIVDLARRSGAAVVVDEHNVESDLRRRVARFHEPGLRRAYNMLEARKLAREERRAWAAVDGVLVVSEHDRSIVSRRTPGVATLVVPNGADIDELVPQPAPAGPPRLVFVGRMDYRPNVDAVRWFVRDVMPLVRRDHPLTLTIVGADPTVEVLALAGRDVEVTGRVPDVRPFLAAASVVVVPLRAGGGTRLKILEAMAMGRPIVSTTIGAEGLAVRNGEQLVLADDPRAMASAIDALLDDPAAANGLGARARALVEERYSWAAIAARLGSWYGDLVARKRIAR